MITKHACFVMNTSQSLCERSSTLHSLHASYFGTETTGTINDYRLDLSESMSEVDQQDSGSPRRRGFRPSTDTTFETTVINTLSMLAGGLADVWQVSSVGHLVALAGQAYVSMQTRIPRSLTPGLQSI
ncbi:TPA: hypothetical protein ACH3X1_015394 [Trebouxia sp. C0004]